MRDLGTHRQARKEAGSGTEWLTGVDCSAAARCASQSYDQLWVQSSIKTSSVRSFKRNDFLGLLFPVLLGRWRFWTWFSFFTNEDDGTSSFITLIKYVLRNCDTVGCSTEAGILKEDQRTHSQSEHR